MILDITWCSANRCNKAESCYRWTQNLQAMAAYEGLSLDGRRISVASFADHNGVCNRYTKLSPEEAHRVFNGRRLLKP